MKAVEYEDGKKKLYKALVAYVIKIFKCVAGITGINRRAFLIQTTNLLTSFRKIVDYRDETTTTILSDWSQYHVIWTGSNTILLLEMNAKFSYLHQLKLKMLSNTRGSKLNTEALMDLCEKYNSQFQIYSRPNVDSFEYKYILVNYYVKYLESVLQLGTCIYAMIAKTSGGNWLICSDFIK